MAAAEDAVGSRARTRRFRGATWSVASVLSIGIIVLVGASLIDSYGSMVTAARQQAEGVAGGIVRVVDLQVDASLGPLIALRNAVDSPDLGLLHTRLAEVRARHPELSSFVALDDEGKVVASSGSLSVDWQPSLRTAPQEMLGVPVRVAVAAGNGDDAPRAIRVIVGSRIRMPSAFAAEIDSARVGESLRHTGLAPGASIAVLSRHGRVLVSNHGDESTIWDRHVPAPGETGHFDTEGPQGRLYSYAASETHPYIVLVGVDRRALTLAWQRQAMPSALAALALILLLVAFTVWLGRAYRQQDGLKAQYRFLFDHSPLPTWIFDAHTQKILAVNEAALATYGYERAAFLELTINDLHAADQEPRLRRLLDDGTAFDEAHTWMHRHRDGHLIYMRCQGAHIDFFGKQARLIVGLDFTAKFTAERELAASEARLRMLARATNDAVWDIDLQGESVWWSDAFYIRYGYSRDEDNGLSAWLGRLHPDDRQQVVDGFAAAVRGKALTWRMGYRMRRKQGDYVDVMARAYIIRDEEGNAIRSVGGLSDQTAQMQARRALEERESAYRLLVEQMPLPLLIVRNDEIVYANRQAEERLGRDGRTLTARAAADFMDSDALNVTRGLAPHGTHINAWLNPDQGAPFEAELAFSDYHDARGSGTQIIVRDMTDQRRYEERLAYQATHDELTGLPNRRALQAHLDEMIMEAAASQSGLMLLFIDLDHFKFINDALGHMLGDEVLRDVTLRLTDAIDDRSYVGRFGGDEFVAAIPFSCSPARALDVLPVIQQAIEAPFIVGGTEQHIKCSIGVAFAPRDGNDAETLIRNADTAMYDAKRKGRHTWRRYSSEMHDVAMARLAVLSRLSGTSLDHELALHYQSQHGADGSVIGVEALLRWPAGPGELSRADRLVPLLEETGAIVHIGKWVLREACRQQRAIAAAVGHPCRVAVNISAQQLVHTDLVAVVAEALADTGASADGLELELTESAFLTDPDRAIRTLRELRAMGVSIALDDFGTGYSNLTYLSRLPLDTIKIDRHFTTALLHDEVDASICRSIIFMAQSLHLGVIAEGVETDRQREWLLAAGCDRMQGFLFSRPVPLDRLADMLGTRQLASTR
ncbi:diguanylate cyclase (GGDEF)-like protein/PAS domain S-box-containing protein [Luteibacter sp. Sphag1AF]|uniref:EAL domain-containing protein n=1 Tax=Luteibacter sp. Sphag1AF TaxID=2587031 RepID=UPI00161622A9|nr:diguanylate cyclase (GGDEF)-like protein/PAS domain S-box-containing protein [Luteibacter sp. Sphag1AF]